MAKIVVTEFVTLNGVFEEPQNWTAPFFNDEVGAFKFDEVMATDALLLGRVTYEGFAAAWPDRAGDEFADRFNSIPKHVVSTTLKNPAWNNSHVIRDNVADEVSKLKQRYDRDIVIHGSGQLVNSLMPLGLIDEYRLVTFPIVVGSGKPLFNTGAGTSTLNLTDSKPTNTGVLLLTYQPADETSE